MSAITPLTRTAANGYTYLTDGRGFPVETCTRCGGIGVLPEYSNVFHGQCFGCAGAGYRFPKGKPLALAQEYTGIYRSRRYVTVAARWSADTRQVICDLAAGDEIRQGGKGAWRTVTAIRITRRVVGESYIGAGDNKRCIALTLAILVTFADGETVRGWGVQAQRRVDVEALRVERGRLAGEARAAYEATLARRAARSRRQASAMVGANR